MSSEPPDGAAAAAPPASRADGSSEPPRRRRSVRSQSALAVMGRMGGSPYSAWASSYLLSRDEPSAAVSGVDANCQPAAVVASRQPPSVPPPPNPFAVEGGANGQLAGWRPRGNLSDVTLRPCEERQASDADEEDVSHSVRPAHGGAADDAVPPPARRRPSGGNPTQKTGNAARPTSRRHSDASVVRCSAAARLVFSCPARALLHVLSKRSWGLQLLRC